MPTRNESAFIERSLGAVLGQDYPVNKIEVFVVDGCSDDDTVSRVERLARDAPIPVSVVANPEGDIPHGLNRGLDVATGDVIIRVDGHCQVAPDYVRRCVVTLDATGAANVGGVQRAVGQTLVGRAIARAMSSRFGVGDARFHYATTPGSVDTVYLGAFRREVFERVGAFDPDFARAEDSEFNFRLRRAGFTIWLDPAISVTYNVRSTFGALAKQYFSYGYFKALMVRKHHRVQAWRQLVAPTFVLALAAGAFGALLTRRPSPFLAVAGPYAIASLAASVPSLRRDVTVAALLPPTFGVMHLSWGTGFLWGVIDRRQRAPSKGDCGVDSDAADEPVA